MSENKKWTCSQCNQEVPLIGANQHTGGHRTIIQVDLGKYEYERENLKRTYLCLSCWEQEKDKYLPQIKEREYSVCKRKFTKFITENNSPWAGAESVYFHNFCKLCEKSFFDDEAFNETCSANCQKQYDNLSPQEKSELASNQIKSNQIKSNQIKSNQIKSNQIKSNQIKSNQIKSNQIQSRMISKPITFHGF